MADTFQENLESGLEKYLVEELSSVRNKYDLSRLAKKSKRQIIKRKIYELRKFREEMISKGEIDIDPLLKAKRIELDETYSWVDGLTENMDNILLSEVPQLEKWLTKYNELRPKETNKLLEKNGWILKLLHKYYSKRET